MTATSFVPDLDGFIITSTDDSFIRELCQATDLVPVSRNIAERFAALKVFDFVEGPNSNNKISSFPTGAASKRSVF